MDSRNGFFRVLQAAAGGSIHTAVIAARLPSLKLGNAKPSPFRTTTSFIRPDGPGYSYRGLMMAVNFLDIHHPQVGNRKCTR